jgi:catechol 2,3-dioxygenase-like lactoylglutathione lyase family enzyme
MAAKYAGMRGGRLRQFLRHRVAYTLPSQELGGRFAGADHTGVRADNLDVAERFYVELLGAQVVFRVDRAFVEKEMPEQLSEIPPGRNLLELAVSFGSGPNLEFFSAPPEIPACPVCGYLAQRPPDEDEPQHPHLAIWVRPDDLSRWRARLDGAGVPCEGPMQLGMPGQGSMFFNDPFGNHLELVSYGVVEPLPRAHPDLRRLHYRWD